MLAAIIMSESLDLKQQPILVTRLASSEDQHEKKTAAYVIYLCAGTNDYFAETWSTSMLKELAQSDKEHERHTAIQAIYICIEANNEHSKKWAITTLRELTKSDHLQERHTATQMISLCLEKGNKNSKTWATTMLQNLAQSEDYLQTSCILQLIVSENNTPTITHEAFALRQAIGIWANSIDPQNVANTLGAAIAKIMSHYISRLTSTPFTTDDQNKAIFFRKLFIMSLAIKKAFPEIIFAEIPYESIKILSTSEYNREEDETLDLAFLEKYYLTYKTNIAEQPDEQNRVLALIVDDFEEVFVDPDEDDLRFIIEGLLPLDLEDEELQQKIITLITQKSCFVITKLLSMDTTDPTNIAFLQTPINKTAATVLLSKLRKLRPEEIDSTAYEHLFAKLSNEAPEEDYEETHKSKRPRL
jgi:hypothetical protein